MTLEEDYKIAHDNAKNENEHQEAWRVYQAGLFKAGGTDQLIKDLQQELSIRYVKLQIKYLNSVITQREYESKRLSAGGYWYRNQLKKYGLLTSDVPDSWFSVFATNSFNKEKKLIKRGMTTKELETACEPLKDDTRAFYKAIHLKGIKILKDKPEIYETKLTQI